MPDGREFARDASRVHADHWSREEIDAAIAGLARATRSFTQSLGGEVPDSGGAAMPGLGERAAGQAAPTTEPASANEGFGRTRAGREDDREPEIGAPQATSPDRPDVFEERARAAEREAREYLERAKRRADSIVNRMIGAVESEAAEIRREAEEGIRERWRVAEVEAGRYVGDARHVADAMVAERQEMIAGLSDHICSRAEALTGGMDGAERIRGQFDLFIRALSRTADQIAQGRPGREASAPARPGARSSSGERNTLAA